MTTQSNNRRFRAVNAPYFGAHLEAFSRTLSTLTANTTNLRIVFTPAYRGSIDPARLRCGCTVKPVDADGTFLATIKKYDASADAYVTITDALDLEAALIALESVAFVPVAGLTDAQLYCDTGDQVVVEIVNNSAGIDTQPSELTVSGGFFVQDP